MRAWVHRAMQNAHNLQIVVMVAIPDDMRPHREAPQAGTYFIPFRAKRWVGTQLLEQTVQFVEVKLPLAGAPLIQCVALNFALVACRRIR